MATIVTISEMIIGRCEAREIRYPDVASSAIAAPVAPAASSTESARRRDSPF
jgi:hypothetical protein